MEKQEEEKQESTEDDDTGIQPETISTLDRADQIAQMQKRENDRREVLIIREENLEAKKLVGGISEAGQAPVKPKEETPQEYVDKMRKQGWRANE